MEFRDAWMLLFALLAIPVYFGGRMSGGRLQFSSLRLLPGGGLNVGWRARIAWLPDALVALGVVGLAVALAGPRTPHGEQRIEREGIAIMMVIDTSGSMAAIDLSEGGSELTRLDVVKDVFRTFVDGDEELELEGRADDAIGLVSFAGAADPACPITLDHNTLYHRVHELEITMDRRDDGTAIGDALGLAVVRLSRSKAESKVVILLTDGVDNASEDPPLEAADVAETVGVKVYTIGAGKSGMTQVRVTDPKTGETFLRPMRGEIDEETLRLIAERTGGSYFRATDRGELVDVYKQIDAMEKTAIVEEKKVDYTDHFAIAALLALLMASLGWFLGASVLRRLP